VLQRQLVLEQLGEPHDVLRGGLLARAADLTRDAQESRVPKPDRSETLGQTRDRRTCVWTDARHSRRAPGVTATYLLDVCGEALRLVVRLSFGFIPSSHLRDRLLEELGELQLRRQTLLLLLLLHGGGGRNGLVTGYN